MKNLGKLFALGGLVFTLGACSSNSEEDVYSYTNSYTLTYKVGDDEALEKFFTFANFSSKDDIARNINEKLIKHSDGSFTEDYCAHFVKTNPYKATYIDGTEIDLYNGNVRRVNEYTTEVGFLYGAVNGVYHMLSNGTDYCKNYTYYGRLSTSTTSSGMHTTQAYMLDDSLVFDGSTLTVNVHGFMMNDEYDVVDFKMSLTYSKN